MCKCKCKCKSASKCKCKSASASAKKTGRGTYGTSTEDTSGAACPWGGGRISRHDNVNMEVGVGLREAGNEATWLRTDKLSKARPTHAATRGTSRVRVKRFAGIAVTGQNGKRSLIDTKVTRATNNTEPMHAATAGEKQKTASYDKFLRTCREEDPTDERLH